MTDGENTKTKLWEDYKKAESYQSSLGLRTTIPENVNFYEGRQWAKVTEKTKNLPRPVVNIIKMICRNKKSAILASPLRIVYEAEDGSDAGKITRFCEYIMKEMGHRAIDRRAVDAAVKKGSYFYHYYWDASARGKDGRVKGALRCELIDVLSIFFSNPTCRDEQAQDWIIISTRMELSRAKAICDKDVKPEDIKADDSKTNSYGTPEQEGDNLCTVLTRYFRRDGKVYCERATESTVINKPYPITPNVKAAMAELDGKDEESDEEDNTDNTYGAYLYPIVAGSYDEREGSIYGLSEIEGLISNQRSINFTFAMMLLNAQENAWGKYIAHPNALRGQTITNDPGQVIIDYTQTMNGVRKMTEQTLHTAPLEIIGNLVNLTRSSTGATEVMTGEVVGKNMSGAAIAQLQAQASTPIEDLRENFKEVKRKQGLVLAQFFKLYYKDARFSYEDEAPRFNEAGEPILNELGEPVKESKRFFDSFSGEDFYNKELDVVVETTTGTNSSSAGDINILDMLLAKGLISLKTYFKAYPEDAISNKSEIMKGIEEDERSSTKALSERLSQTEKELADALALLQKQKETVDKVVGIIRENSQTKAMLADVYTEAKQKIELANTQLKADGEKITELTEDATHFARMLEADGTVERLRQEAGIVN